MIKLEHTNNLRDLKKHCTYGRLVVLKTQIRDIWILAVYIGGKVEGRNKEVLVYELKRFPSKELLLEYIEKNKDEIYDVDFCNAFEHDLRAYYAYEGYVKSIILDKNKLKQSEIKSKLLGWKGIIK